MNQLVIVGNVILPVLYGAAFIGYLIAFLRKEDKGAEKWTGLALPVTILHAAYLGVRTTALGHPPFFSGPEAASTLAFAMFLFYLVQERQVKMKSVGVFIVGPAFLLQLISSIQIHHVVNRESLYQGFLFQFHVLASMLAYVGFAIAAFYGILFLLLFREIRTRKLSFVFSRLPALETLSRMNHRAVLLAFSLYTLGVGTGTFWAYKVVENYSALDPKQLGTFMIWVLYAVLIGVWGRGRWAGKNGAILSLIGFGSILAVFMTLNLIFHSFHDYTLTQ